jgi:hypothetical protein
MNYKVGDEIIISKPSKEELKMWDNSWTPTMDNYIGKKRIIKEIYQKGFFVINISYSFPLCMLEYSNQTHYEIY